MLRHIVLILAAIGSASVAAGVPREGEVWSRVKELYR
jgi:hypothetical protein